MMNEIEVAYFTLLIDKLGWKYEKIDHWIYFTILGIINKNECLKEDNSILLIAIFSKKYPNFQEIYSKFIINETISSLINENCIYFNHGNRSSTVYSNTLEKKGFLWNLK